MTVPVLPTLLTAPDAWESACSAVAEILAAESSAQAALAEAAELDPAPYRWRVYEERHGRAPWLAEGVLDPVVVVSTEGWRRSEAGGQTRKAQALTLTLRVDVLGFGAGADDGDGHVLGDYVAAARAKRTAALIRQILSAPLHHQLGLGVLSGVGVLSVGVVEARSVPLEERTQAGHAVHGIELRVEVSCAETAPQVSGEACEIVSVAVTRDDGRVLVTLQQGEEAEEP